MLAPFRRIVVANSRHILRLVAGERQPGVDADLAPRIIDEGQAQRHAGRDRDAVEAGFPVIDLAARALRRDGQVQAFIPREGLDEAIHETGALAPIHRDAAKTAEEGAERRAEKRVLADEADRGGDGEARQDADDEIPIGRVRVDDHHRLRHGRRNEQHAPSEEPQ